MIGFYFIFWYSFKQLFSRGITHVVARQPLTDYC